MESEEHAKIDVAAVEQFEIQRSGYFAHEYRTTSMYWSTLCDLVKQNDESTQQVLMYVTGKLEADRLHTAAIYANADKVFGDKKGNAKLRHDKIRHAEMKAKNKGQAPPYDPEAHKPGGPRQGGPTNSTIQSLWEIAEMDCRAARYQDTVCEELEQDRILGKVKSMAKDTHKQFKELMEEGDNCLTALMNIDQRVGSCYTKLKETIGDQVGGKPQHEDIWFLDCRYRTAVVHQKEAWEVVTSKMRDVFSNIKGLEARRRDGLRTFLVEAVTAIQSLWHKFPTLCQDAFAGANSLDASQAGVDREVSAMASAGVAEKRRQSHDEESRSGRSPDTIPSDTSFIDSLTAPLESPLVRAKMMLERRHAKTMGSTYHPGLMILTWDGFIHFFDLPGTSSLKSDASPAAAFQDIAPTMSLQELTGGKKDIEEGLSLKATASLELDDDATVEVVSSQKSNKFEVTGTRKQKAIKKFLGSGHKSLLFRASSEAEMNFAVEVVKACVKSKGGMGGPPERTASDSLDESKELHSAPSWSSAKNSTSSPAESEPSAPPETPTPSEVSTMASSENPHSEPS